MKIVFIRHGETHESQNYLYQTNASRLTKEAQQEVISLSSHLKKFRQAPIIVSEQDRSGQTAQLLFPDTNLKTDPLLNELKEPFSLRGQAIKKDNSFLYKAIDRYDSNPNFKIEDSESLQQFITRAYKFKNKLEKTKKDWLFCVGHGLFIRTFLLSILLPKRQITGRIIKNFLISLKLNKLHFCAFTYTKKWSLLIWNSPLSDISS